MTMKSGEECVIQFRVEPIDVEDFKSARRLLGSVVPDIEKVPDATLEEVEVFPYYMTLAHGKPWLEVGDEAAVISLRSLGRILSRGCVADNSVAVVETYVAPKLESFLASTDKRVKPFQGHVEKILSNITQLKQLPLFISHVDLNKMNIHLYEDGRVAEIVDWEGATKFPFGMGLCRIHHLAGDFANGKFNVPDGFEAAEREFWSELLANTPVAVQKILKNNPEAVQMSLIAGMLIEDLDSENFNKVALNALPKLLTYRIPALRRAGEAPYKEPESK